MCLDLEEQDSTKGTNSCNSLSTGVPSKKDHQCCGNLVRKLSDQLIWNCLNSHLRCLDYLKDYLVK